MATARKGLLLGVAAAAVAVAGIGWWAFRSAELPAPPPEAAASPAKPPLPPLLAAGKCTFDVREQPVEKTLKYVRPAAGEVRIEVAPELIDRRITLKVTALPWIEALEAVAKEAGGVLEEEPGVVRIVRPAGAPIDDMAALVAKCRAEGEAFRAATKDKDFLRAAAARRSYRESAALLEEKLRDAARKQPEFARPDLQARYVAEVKSPFAKVKSEFEAEINPPNAR